MTELDRPTAESQNHLKAQGQSQLTERAFGSPEFRASAAAIIATVVGIVLVAILQKGLGITDGATIVTLLLVPLLIYGIVSGRLLELTGPGGWGAKFAKLETELERTKEQVEKQQNMVNEAGGPPRMPLN